MRNFMDKDFLLTTETAKELFLSGCKNIILESNHDIKMLFDKITPEEAGIESRYIADYISVLERHGLTTHSLLMMKGEKIFRVHLIVMF